MIGIEKTAEVLGLTPRQVYRRVTTLRPTLSPYLRKGDNGRLLLDGSAVEILRRAEVLRSEGHTLRQAVDLITEEINGKQGREPGQATGSDGKLIEVLQEEILYLRKEVAWLRSQVDQLALPRPRRRWLAWLLPSRLNL